MNTSNWWLAGFNFAGGAAATVCAVLLCFSLFIYLFGNNEKDATDPPNGQSNLGLLIDHETGCHYLRANGGGITPRMNANGKHICEKGGPNA